MAAVASLDSMNATLSQWLRLLWDMSAPVRLDSALPYIAQGVIHLPSGSHWREPSAAASHAAAHLVYSPPSFNGEGLGPIARALVALLEDARVEALAMRELPGLARLWRPLHTASPATGAGFEALMQRLARALADPGYDDPDPWVRKGRALFFLDATLGLLALRTPADVRKAAVLLGNDIGQMRLQFNAKTYRPAPAYRDDHRWMWAADVLTQVPPPAVAAGGDVLDDHDPAVDTNEVVTHHPEWDHLISRVRADWCRVVERPAPPGGDATAPYDGDVVRAGLRLRAPLRRLTHLSAVPCRSDEGEAFDLGALVDWRVARQLRHAADPRVYRAIDPRRASAAVWLLVDRSASTAAVVAHGKGQGGHSVLHGAARCARAMASALQAIGVACAVSGFSSQGRHAVHLETVKSFDEEGGERLGARLLALRPGGSTRLGAALRHAARRLAQRRAAPLWVIVLSDGEANDIDVHDPRYLVEDARHAVAGIRRFGVHSACIVLGSQRGADARRIFGSHGVQPLRELSQLPRVVQRLLA